MAIPAEEMAARAAQWAESDLAVRAAVVYGSLARGVADEDSDLDLIIVAEPGQRDGLWERRDEISALVLGRPAAWSQEPAWQRPYRYQSWDDRLAELDLTLDEEHVAPWAALARGFRALIDKAGVGDRLTSDLASLQPREFDAPALDGGTWAWLNYLHGKLRHGETWLVRYGVMDTLTTRVLPLLGTAGHSACRELDTADLRCLEEAAPVSSDPAELRRSLRATAELYDAALDRWAKRTGQPRPRNPLSPPIVAKLREPGA
jgi:predicted nucleotidyltransferase